MEFIGKCFTKQDLDQTITISIDASKAIVEVWDTTKSYPILKIQAHCLFIGNDLIISDGNGSTLVLVAINNRAQFNIKGYYVLSGKYLMTFEVHHRVAKRYMSSDCVTDHIDRSNSHHNPILPRNFHCVGYATAKL